MGVEASCTNCQRLLQLGFVRQARNQSPPLTIVEQKIYIFLSFYQKLVSIFGMKIGMKSDPFGK